MAEEEHLSLSKKSYGEIGRTDGEKTKHKNIEQVQLDFKQIKILRAFISDCYL